MVTKKRGNAAKLTALVVQARSEKASALARKKDRLEALVRLIARRATSIRESFYDIGVALTEIVKNKLYEADGHASFEAFLQARQLGSRAQAYKLIAIAAELDRDQAIVLGQEKAAALIAHAAATPEADSALSLAKSGRFGAKSTAQASVGDIEKATRAVRAKERASKPKTAAQKAAIQADRATLTRVKRWLGKANVKASVALHGQSVLITLARKHADALP